MAHIAMVDQKSLHCQKPGPLNSVFIVNEPSLVTGSLDTGWTYSSELFSAIERFWCMGI